MQLVTSIRKFEANILAPNAPKTKIVSNCTTKYELPHILTCGRLNFASHEASATASWIFCGGNTWFKSDNFDSSDMLAGSAQFGN